jgi:hypothetical protein
MEANTVTRREIVPGDENRTVVYFANYKKTDTGTRGELASRFLLDSVTSSLGHFGWRAAMILSISLMFAGVGLLCIVMYFSAVYALPVAVGFWAGFWALHSGAGIGSVAIGLAAGTLTFALGQITLSTSHSAPVRWAIFLAFVLPASYAGYRIVLQLAEIGIPSLVWRHGFAVIGAIVVGISCIARLTVPALSSPRRLQTATTGKRPRPTGLQKTILLPE